MIQPAVTSCDKTDNMHLFTFCTTKLEEFKMVAMYILFTYWGYSEIHNSQDCSKEWVSG